MGPCCCSPRIGSIYPIEESLLNAMDALKLKKYNIEYLKGKLKIIFEKNNKNSQEIDLRNLFLDNNFETNSHYVLQNSFFDLFIANLEKFAVKEILILVFPLLNNVEEKDKLIYVELLSDYFFGEGFTYKNLEFVLKKVFIFYTRKINVLLAKLMDQKKDKICLENMNSKLFAETRINSFLSNIMQKIKFTQANAWGDKVSIDECTTIIKKSKIWDFEEIRNNFLMD